MRSVLSVLVSVSVGTAAAQMEFHEVDDVNWQPLISHAGRLAQALEALGSALPETDLRKLEEFRDSAGLEGESRQLQALLDPYCLAMVHIDGDGEISVARGPAPAVLMQAGWRSFLIKVHNELGERVRLTPYSPNAEPAFHRSLAGGYPKERNLLSPGDSQRRFLELRDYRRRPMSRDLSRATLEYRILQIYTTETEAREARIDFRLGNDRSRDGSDGIVVEFRCEPSVKVVLDITDFDGAPVMASFVIRDDVERLVEEPSKSPYPVSYRDKYARIRPWETADGDVKRLRGIYPLPARRVAALDEYPDFYFHPQVYRSSGEHVYLPAGNYEVTYTRGPEYLSKTRTITVPRGVEEHREEFRLERWINMAELGWYSGDHHVHAAGCSHYESPEAGVDPSSMFRQALGEDLNVSCILSWGPCWYYQKEFFDGSVHSNSTPSNLIRYDVEVSGFPSSHAGHLCLLRLREDDYPGAERIEDWPSWTLPVLQWAKSQGGIVGYAHSGWGLEPQEPTDDLPNYVLPKMDGIGANEYIVAVTHDAVDFISTIDTPAPWELNIWYHTLNCGFRTRISGETDFPCIYDARIGMGRSYVKLDGELNFDSWMEGIRRGANYVSDGSSHTFDFRVNDVAMGEGESELRLASSQTVTITAKVAALLPVSQDDIGRSIASKSFADPPYWDIERAREGDSRTVMLELIVNGESVASQPILADGSIRDVAFSTAISRSSWVALRILASSHTNPVFVVVDNQPIRVSRRSAQWCLDAVDQCWRMKEPAIRDSEKEDAKKAYDHARRVYEKIREEANVD